MEIVREGIEQKKGREIIFQELLEFAFNRPTVLEPSYEFEFAEVLVENFVPEVFKIRRNEIKISVGDTERIVCRAGH